MRSPAVLFLSRFCHVGSLWTFGSLGDLELYLIAFLQALVSFSRYRAVVHENIWSTFASDKAIPFGIVEPFHSTVQAFHVTPSGTHFLRRVRAFHEAILRLSEGAVKSRDNQKRCI
jgi:hypothetical protein